MTCDTHIFLVCVHVESQVLGKGQFRVIHTHIAACIHGEALMGTWACR